MKERKTIVEKYLEIVKNNKNFQEDEKQLQLLKELDIFASNIERLEQEPYMLKLIKRLLAIKINNKKYNFYLYGNVGCGKSFISQIFFDNIEVKKKKRVHFSEFIADIQKRLHKSLLDSKKKDRSNIIKSIAKGYIKDIDLLYIDELQVTDIADAMIIGQLFKELFSSNMPIILTSNRNVKDLYKGGLQREKFLHFVEIIQENMVIYNLDSNKDYRKEIYKYNYHYYYPLDSEAEKFIEELFYKYTGVDIKEAKELVIDNGTRDIVISRYSNKLAIFTFHELCEKPLGSMDYAKIVNILDVVIVTSLRKLSREDRNEAQRLIRLVDQIYEANKLLIITAEVAIDDIYIEGDGEFEFQRTISRLKEMQSQEYIDNIIKDTN